MDAHSANFPFPASAAVACVSSGRRRFFRPFLRAKELLMLVLSRRLHESIWIGGAKVMILRLKDGSVRLGIDADAKTVILRDEVKRRDEAAHRKQAARRKAAEAAA